LATNTLNGDANERRPLLIAAWYALMVVVTLLVFFAICRHGESLVAPPPAQGATRALTLPDGEAFLRVLLALTAIVATGQVLSRLFFYLSQPPVIGEVVAGILLGPSFLGPETSALILPPSVAPNLGVIAQLGVVLYMFVVGLELNPSLLRRRAHATVAISHASIIVPFVLGALLALPLYPRLSSSDVGFTGFALFLGVAMSITAFPVLARVLTDYGLSRTRLGALALGCAAIDDVTAWCLLAFVVGVVQAEVGDGLLVSGRAMAYIAVMFILVRPTLEALVERWSDKAKLRALVSALFVALLLSTATAEAIGIHAIFGAFLIGAVVPHNSTAARMLSRQLENVVTILMLPAFFAFTGMRTRIDLLTEPSHWVTCGMIVLIATLGKFGGTFVAARFTGLGWRDAAILGTLMNTRGLMELIVLNVGLDLKVISPTLFAMMIVMALVTTALTSPLLKLLRAHGLAAEEAARTSAEVAAAPN
jgi:Kef-type K+ transport system membrane component KefB